MKSFLTGDYPEKPYDCKSAYGVTEANGIYDIMKIGWNADPEKRFSPQNIFSTLLSASKLECFEFTER